MQLRIQDMAEGQLAIRGVLVTSRDYNETTLIEMDYYVQTVDVTDLLYNFGSERCPFHRRNMSQLERWPNRPEAV